MVRKCQARPRIKKTQVKLKVKLKPQVTGASSSPSPNPWYISDQEDLCKTKPNTDQATSGWIPQVCLHAILDFQLPYRVDGATPPGVRLPPDPYWLPLLWSAHSRKTLEPYYGLDRLEGKWSKKYSLSLERELSEVRQTEITTSWAPLTGPNQWQVL